MPKRSCLAIILAAGEGTRMKSATPKVLHKVAGLPMLGHVLKAAEAGGAGDIAVVVGPGMEAVTAFLAREAPAATTFVQEQRLGTGHAVLAAKKALAAAPDQVLVMYGDTPLVTAATLKKMRAGACPRCRPGGAGLPPGRSGPLRPADHGWQTARCDPRVQRRHAGGARDRLLQCRRHGVLAGRPSRPC